MEVSGQLHAPAALPSGRSHPSEAKVGPRIGLEFLAKKFLSLARARTPDSPARSLVSILITIHQLVMGWSLVQRSPTDCACHCSVIKGHN